MNKKGFTLIELLVVIILIAAIVLLALPKITNSIKNYSTNVDKTTFNIIKEATKLYISDNENSFIKRSENTYCVPLNTLIKEEYLKNTIEYNNQDITDTKVMKVTYNNGFNYELVNKNDCERVVKFDTVCEADSEQLYATNELDKGYKYNCKVDPDKPRYNFYVLSYNDENGNITFDKETAKSVNLIMDRNICEDGTLTENDKNCITYWITDSDYGCGDDYYCPYTDKGPVTAMTYLNNATSSWDNVSNLNIMHDDEENYYEKFKINGKARLPYGIEVSDYDGTNRYLYSNFHLSCFNNGGQMDPAPCSEAGWIEGIYEEDFEHMEGIYGYWTLSAAKSANDHKNWVKMVSYVGKIDGTLPNIHGGNGVRPVINLKI